MKVYVKVSTIDKKPAIGIDVIGMWEGYPDSTCMVKLGNDGNWYTTVWTTSQPDYWLEEQEGLSKDSLISDRLFIQEIINDLEKNGYVKSGKAFTMLRDWSGELRNKTHLNGKTKATHAELVGSNLY